ncbi:hypothetical protein ACIO93_00855 [Streptomyces sp. NPDC087903]|uniref:hypothetical protein n=1 Tax=Streptomyces sp. NPDC087903 TaxID=3365819 RepID=UPI00381019F9
MTTPAGNGELRHVHWYPICPAAHGNVAQGAGHGGGAGRHRQRAHRRSAAAQAALPRQQIADPVHYWNDVLLQVIRREGGGPGPMARSAAMLNAAIYDAESSYQLK